MDNVHSSDFSKYTTHYPNLACSFRRSRDLWSHKHQDLKPDHMRLQNQLRDVRKSCDSRQQRFQKTKKQYDQLDYENQIQR
ncbi:MAG: hypothetical protein ACFCD0_13720 [Gemmataceae bacterium]